MARSQRMQKIFPAQQTAGLNQQVVYDIPLTADLSRLTLTLSGTVTLSVAAANLKRDGICELIKSVELKKNGSNSIVSVPFSTVVQGNIPRRAKSNVPTLLQPLLTVATQPFRASGVIDLAAYGAMRPKDSVVSETDCTTLQLIVTFGSDFSDVFNGGTVGTSAISFRVKGDEVIELMDAKGNRSRPTLIPLVSSRDDNVGGAVTRQRFRLTPGQALRTLSLRASTLAMVNSDALLSAVRVYVGTVCRLDLTAQDIKDMNDAEFQSKNPTGWYYLNLAEQGEVPDRLEDCYDLRDEALQGSDAYIEYDSSAALVLQVCQNGFKSA